jgi:hypothetical protein
MYASDIRIFLFWIWLISSISSTIWPYIMFNRILKKNSLQPISFSPVGPQILPIINECNNVELKKKLKSGLRIMNMIDSVNFLLFLVVLGFHYIVAYLFG